jgi:hypothetical protein
MKKIKLLMALFVGGCLPAQAQTLTIYYSPVPKPAQVWDEYHYQFHPQTLAEDMAGLLQQALGKTVATAPFTGKAATGIFLLLDSSANCSAKEAAWVSCNGSNTLQLKARYANGLSYAVYTYLDRLGFRFYLPGKAWTIVPPLASAFPKAIAQQEWKPWFKHRYCTMSGGMPAVKGLDDKRINAMDWYQWYRRNRMGSEYMGIGGHIGELFNMEHKKEIEQDPTLIAPEDGKTRQYSISAKLDPMNARGVEMFTDWIVKQYRLNNQTAPAWVPRQAYQTVDPGDGLGYCHTPECGRRFKTISDQAIYLANIAAKKMAKAYPGTGVSLYAYTERTDTPSLKLEPNVHVEVVATAFHNVATPAALVARWAKKTTNLTVYDYLNIGVWHKEEPFFDLGQYFKYLNHLQSLKVKGLTFEAAPSKFSSGLLQYFILRYLSEPYANVQQEFEAFARNCFGNAAGPIANMMQEWYFSGLKLATHYDNPTFHEDELGRFFGYMEAASAPGLAQGPGAQQRLNELKAYLVYLTQHFEYWNDVRQLAEARKTPALRKQKAEAMLQYTWKLYRSQIFHNTQLNDVLRWYFPEDKDFMQRWDYFSSPIFAGFDRPYDATADYRKALATYLPKAQPAFAVTDALLEKAAKLTPDSIRIKLIDAEAFGMFRHALQVYCPSPGKLTVRFEAGKSQRPNPKMPSPGFVAMVAEDYRYYSEKYLEVGKPSGQFVFDLPQKGKYTLWLAQNNSTPIDFTIRPGKSLLYLHKKTIPMNGVMLLDETDGKYKGNRYLAIFVPQVDSLAYNMLYPDCVNYVQLYNAKGKVLPQNNDQSPYHISVAVPPADANGFAYFTNGLFRWPPVFKKVPPCYFFLKYPGR